MTFDILIVVVTPVTHFKVEEKKKNVDKLVSAEKDFFLKSSQPHKVGMYVHRYPLLTHLPNKQRSIIRYVCTLILVHNMSMESFPGEYSREHRSLLPHSRSDQPRRHQNGSVVYLRVYHTTTTPSCGHLVLTAVRR